MFPIKKPHDCKRFAWDFWYYYDKEIKDFHLLYLNADRSLVPENQHHFSSVVGYARTKDFSEVEWIKSDVFHAQPDSWDNTSIWSGDIIRCKNGYLLFYASRDSRVHDKLTQNIGLAYSSDFLKWKRIRNFRLKPDPRYYEQRTVEGDDTIHSWRDPFLFRYNGGIYMLVAAKSVIHKPTCKGTIGLLRAKDNCLTEWDILPPLYSPGWVSECDVPILYQYNGKLMLVYSVWSKYDHAPSTYATGGLHLVEGRGMDLSPANFSKPPSILLAAEELGYYACRVIPELGGDAVGHHYREGGWSRIPLETGFEYLDRDFSDLTFEI